MLSWCVMVQCGTVRYVTWCDVMSPRDAVCEWWDRACGLRAGVYRRQLSSPSLYLPDYSPSATPPQYADMISCWSITMLLTFIIILVFILVLMKLMIKYEEGRWMDGWIQHNVIKFVWRLLELVAVCPFLSNYSQLSVGEGRTINSWRKVEVEVEVSRQM